ncbi:hypothetical protein XC93_10760 [Klebsiella variicola]|nr:hypothetical protein [Klebsiella variicola]MDT7025547.1 hypothetical protein [Klebsiella variicola]
MLMKRLKKSDMILTKSLQILNRHEERSIEKSEFQKHLISYAMLLITTDNQINQIHYQRNKR